MNDPCVPRPETEEDPGALLLPMSEEDTDEITGALETTDPGPRAAR